jgi:RNA polymerase sigma-70 factor (ECF subfamily)
VQETVITVAKKIPEFKYDPAIGSFKGWLMQITRWRVLNHIRKKHYECGGKRMPKEEPLDTALLEVEADKGFQLEKLWDDEWRANLAEAALEQLKKKSSARDYQIFYLHVFKKVPATEVARRMDIKLAEVYFIKYKLSRLIQRERKALEKQFF